MNAVLRLEQFSDTSDSRRWLTRLYGNRGANAQFRSYRPYCALVSGQTLEFLKPKRDYAAASGERGQFLEYILEEGRVYQVRQRTESGVRTYYCTCLAGSVVELSHAEVRRA